mmetsp:Transcript_33597/g.117786  ORF Transcript_33597/g.117786 Transcript_33597/m.117786 type:complete len:241 (-) Transcript_33597:2613-3335(-)
MRHMRRCREAARPRGRRGVVVRGRARVEPVCVGPRQRRPSGSRDVLRRLRTKNRGFLSKEPPPRPPRRRGRRALDGGRRRRRAGQFAGRRVHVGPRGARPPGPGPAFEPKVAEAGGEMALLILRVPRRRRRAGRCALFSACGVADPAGAGEPVGDCSESLRVGVWEARPARHRSSRRRVRAQAVQSSKVGSDDISSGWEVALFSGDRARSALRLGQRLERGARSRRQAVQDRPDARGDRA